MAASHLPKPRCSSKWVFVEVGVEDAIVAIDIIALASPEARTGDAMSLGRHR